MVEDIATPILKGLLIFNGDDDCEERKVLRKRANKGVHDVSLLKGPTEVRVLKFVTPPSQGPRWHTPASIPVQSKARAKMSLQMLPKTLGAATGGHSLNLAPIFSPQCVDDYLSEATWGRYTVDIRLSLA